MDAVTGFAELALQARDPNGLARFYREAFGLEQLAHERDRIRLAAGTRARLGLWSPGEKEFGDDGGDRALYARDPEGNVVEAWDLFERDSACMASLRG